MENLHVLIVKYVGMTASRSPRVKIISERFKSSISFDHANDDRTTLEQAICWLSNDGYNIVGHGNGKGHDYVITDTFKSPASK